MSAPRTDPRLPSPEECDWEAARSRLPPAPESEDELERLLSAPHPDAHHALARCAGDVLVLGAGGKMGPSLATMLRRTLDEMGDRRRVIAVSRFSAEDAARSLESVGVEALRCDLTDRAAVERLPDAPNVIFMAGQKFGTRDAPAATWAMNAIVPAICAERFAESRIVAFSTGNVYALTSVGEGGARESDPPAPVGEYASSCLARERIFEYYSGARGTRVAAVRLNYAIDLRYGVLTDIALRVWRGQAVDLGMGYVNVIWQGDANRFAIACLERAASPPFVVNVTGAHALSVRALAGHFGRLFGREPVFSGAESPDALLSDTTRMRRELGAPAVSPLTMVFWVAEWIRRGGRLLGKETKFERRDGRY